jgi:hypothetical protein
MSQSTRRFTSAWSLDNAVNDALSANRQRVSDRIDSVRLLDLCFLCAFAVNLPLCVLRSLCVLLCGEHFCFQSSKARSKYAAPTQVTTDPTAR